MSSFFERHPWVALLNKVWIAIMTVGPFLLFALVTILVRLLKHG